MARGSNRNSPPSEAESGDASGHEIEEFSSISTAAIKSLGESLKDARTGRFTIEELAAKSSISAGRISQIERGIANPSFETLWRLTTALGISIRSLFPADGGVEKRQVVRKQERRRLDIPHDGLSYEMLTPNGNGALEIFFLDIPPGYDGARRFLSHAGEKFMHVLDGELTVHVADKEWTLQPGDSITFEAVEPHFIRNNSKRSTRIELVVTPPIF